jgi:hypothetical protein
MTPEPKAALPVKDKKLTEKPTGQEEPKDAQPVQEETK